MVEDSAARTVLYLPRFSVVYATRGGRLVPSQWDASTLRIVRPGSWHSLLFFWDARSRQPLHWYVNLETPARRWACGFESRDLRLDVLISPDGSLVTWKDEPEFEVALSTGTISATEALPARETAMDVIEEARSLTGPFGEGWPAWRPPVDTVAVLPEDWSHVDGYPPTVLEPGYELYSGDEVEHWAVELVRRARRA